MHVRVLCIAVATALLAFHASAFPVKPSNEITSTLTNVFAAGEHGYFCIKIPDLLQTSKRTLIAMGEARMESCSDFAWTDLVMKRSTDGGKTWGPLVVLVSNSTKADKNVIGNAAPVQERNSGTIFVPYCRNNIEVYLITSDDDGVTWSEPQALPDAADPEWKWVGLGPPSSIQLESGRILVPAYHTTLYHGDGEASHGHTVYSDDFGKTWKVGARDFGGIHLSNECQAVDLGNNTVMINARTFGTHRVQTVSHDGGLTFGSTREVALRESWQGCEGSMIRHSSGTLFFSNPKSDGIFRKDMSLFFSKDQGQSWEFLKLIDAGPSAYSALAELQDGSVALLYERSPETKFIFVPKDISFEIVWLPTEGFP